ncbi:MAG: ORF6N domain-containing protein, partial [archaeon]
NIKNKIHTIRDVQVMLDSDLAVLYKVQTKVINQAVKRNIERFPKDFMFQLTENEKLELVTNCDHLKDLKFSYTNPYAFTEQGVASLSGILKSKRAIEINIKIMRAFVVMRRFISKNAELFLRLDTVEQKQLEFQLKADKQFEKIFEVIDNKEFKKKQGIFYDGQVFDAHNFVSDLIRSAEKSIILIDNYIDDTVLSLFAKRKENIKVIIYTKSISKQLENDLDKFNLQYQSIEIKEFHKSHDRFIILDNKDVYHFGASLKDLGEKWFGFSKFDIIALDILKKLE